jgi:hypothetical protein
MAYSPHREFSALYKLYTSDPGSLGQRLTHRMQEVSLGDPLLVVTGADVVLYPGSGKTPITESFRRSTRGFIELASISHLGTAVAWIVRLRELKDAAWRDYARRLIDQIEKTRRINSEDLWRRDIAVPALAGLESKIADMIDYSCAVTSAFLDKGMADESLMTFAYLREHYLQPVGDAGVPIPINDMMVGTFGLAFLDIAHRIMRWLRENVREWERLMVMLSGRSGRPTAGLSWETNNMCHLLLQASNDRLLRERVYIAPHAPSFVLAEVRDADHLRLLGEEYRGIWLNTRASVDLARAMFEGFPAFEPDTQSKMPPLEFADDRFTAITRMRIAMEDPGQLLANSVATYIIDRLCDCGDRPERVLIPGFTNVNYPRRALGVSGGT